MLGPQEGSDENGGEKSQQQQKKKLENSNLSPHTPTHHPPLTVFCPEEKSLSRNGCFY